MTDRDNGFRITPDNLKRVATASLITAALGFLGLAATGARANYLSEVQSGSTPSNIRIDANTHYIQKMTDQMSRGIYEPIIVSFDKPHFDEFLSEFGDRQTDLENGSQNRAFSVLWSNKKNHFVAMQPQSKDAPEILSSWVDSINTIEEDVMLEPQDEEGARVIGADRVRKELGIDAKNQVVAVLDSGANLSQVIAGYCSSTTNVSEGVVSTTSLCDDGRQEQVGIKAGAMCTESGECTHGQAVSETSLSVANSRLLEAKIYSLNADGTIIAYLHDMVSAMEYVASRTDLPIDAVVISSGGKFSSTREQSPAFEAAVDDLDQRNIATVLAAGNSDRDPANQLPGATFPASIDHPGIVPVAAVERGAITSYSNVPPWGHLAGPDSSCTSTGCFTGTSFAAPYVAGSYALLNDVSSINPESAETLFADYGKRVYSTRGGYPVSAVLVNDFETIEQAFRKKISSLPFFQSFFPSLYNNK